MFSFALALAGWQIISLAFNPFLIPPPLQVAAAAVPMLKDGELFSNTAISLVRVAVGFVSGSLLAVLIGVPMGRIRIVNDVLDPIIELLRYLSPTAMIPIAVIWFGIGELAKYFLIFWGTFFIVLINTAVGVSRTPIARQRAAQCLGATNLQIFILVILPSAIPYIIIGMRIAMASSFMSIIPAEILAADSGLGYLLQTSGLLLQTDRIFVALAAISIIGFITDRLFRWAANRALSRYMERLALP
jgi:NitT/TauT family transport system permease protein/taurine transport system permease protein